MKAVIWYVLHTKLHQSCLTLCGPMDCSPPGSSVHEILQARILEWVAMPSSRGSSPPTDLLRLLRQQVGYLLLVPPGKHLYKKENTNFQKFCNVIQNIILLIVDNNNKVLFLCNTGLLMRSVEIFQDNLSHNGGSSGCSLSPHGVANVHL